VILQKARETLTSAARVAGEDDLVAAPAQIAHVLRNRFVDIDLLRPLGREVARGLGSQVDGSIRFGFREGKARWIGRSASTFSHSFPEK